MSKTAVPTPAPGRDPARASDRGQQRPRPPQTTRAQTATSARASVRRMRRRVFVAFGCAAAAVVIAAGLVVVALAEGSPWSDAAVSPPKGSPVPAPLTAKLISVRLSTIDAAPTISLNAPTTTRDSPLRASGEPDLLYVGAEFCPLCVAERGRSMWQ